GDLRPLPVAQVVVALMQPLLRLPCVRDHGWRLPLLSTFEVNTRLRPMPVAPRGLDQDMSTVTVAGLGDRAESLPVTTRVLARDESEIARELGGPLETAPVDDLRRQHHRRVQGDATEALQLAHHRREGRELG